MPTIPKHTAGARGPDIYIAMDRAQNELSQTAPAGSSAPSGPGSTAGGAPPVFAAMSATSRETIRGSLRACSTRLRTKSGSRGSAPVSNWARSQYAC